MIPYAKESNQNDESIDEFQKKQQDVEWHHRVLLNRPSKVVFVGCIVAILIPILLYNYVFYSSLEVLPPDGYSVGSCLVTREARLPCGMGDVNQTDCHSQCCYDLELNVCFHRFPSRFTYILEDEWQENTTLTPRIEETPFQSEKALNIKIAFDEVTPTHLAIALYDAKEDTIKSRKILDKKYTYHVSTPEISIVVNDTEENTIFNTAQGPIIAAEDIFEIAFKLTDEDMYGLGEIPLKEDTVKVLYNHAGDFNGLPLIFSRVNGSYRGLLVDIPEPTELKVTGNNQILVRTMTRNAIKFHLFMGPQPQDIMKEVMDFLDFKPKVEYWMLGAHICSDNPETDANEDLQDFLTNAENEGLPYESHCGTKPVHFHDQDCYPNHITSDSELIRKFRKRFIPHLSPFVYFNEPNIKDYNSTEIAEPRVSKPACHQSFVENLHKVLLKTPDGSENYKGIIGKDTVLYPDYEFVSKDILKELWSFEVNGIFLDNSWPLDETTKMHSETRSLLPYFSEDFEIAFNHTPQWNVTRPNGAIHMYSHNQYGNHFANAFRPSKQYTPIWTSSQWLNNDIPNRQNVTTSWATLSKELTHAAIGSISGYWLWTSPICGDTEQYNNETHTHLCVKWYQAATYFPLIRIHSDGTPRHPLSFNGNNKAYIKTALNQRLALLPYFYTTLHKGPLLRPMFYQFPESERLSNLISQFSVGEDLLIVPNLLPSQTHVLLYKPPGVWYELWSGLPLRGEDEKPITMTTTDADFLVAIRGGAIVVMQKDVKLTAEETRKESDYTIMIALHCMEVNTTENIDEQMRNDQTNVTTCSAEGKLYMDDDLTITFEADDEKLHIKALGTNFKVLCDKDKSIWANIIKEINIYGLDDKHNNNDYHRSIFTSIDLCQLEGQTLIEFDFLTKVRNYIN